MPDDFDSSFDTVDTSADIVDTGFDSSADTSPDTTWDTVDTVAEDTQEPSFESTDASDFDIDFSEDVSSDFSADSVSETADDAVMEDTGGDDWEDFAESAEDIPEDVPDGQGWDTGLDMSEQDDWIEEDTQEDPAVLKREEYELLETGNRNIEDLLDVKADDYRDQGLSEEEIADRLAADRWQLQEEFLRDAFPGQDVSPNVFNGFQEHGAKDRISQMESSESLRQAMNGSDTEVKAPDAWEDAFEEDIASEPEDLDPEEETEEADWQDEELSAEETDWQDEELPGEEADSSDPSVSEMLEDPELFDRNQPGDYTYEEDGYGKHASGQLTLEKGQRNAYAQRTVGGDDREIDDDGGHLIGSRFAGSGEYENLDAQNRDVNRGDYKRMENSWADALEQGDRVFVDVNTYKSNGSDRPDAYMGYSITEKADGSREWDAFSYQNASHAEQEQWENIVEEMDAQEDDPKRGWN